MAKVKVQERPKVVLKGNEKIGDTVTVFYNGTKMLGRLSGKWGTLVDVNIYEPVKGCAECEVAE